MQFRTKARAVDLLGKGQIADLPTAITELWKNGYDAYADKLTAEIYLKGYKDISSPIFIMTDDGKGMSKQDIFEKWLVLGTDSKSRRKNQDVEGEETLWKKPRIKAGEKGIGRLSVAFLGNPMLMLTKKIGFPLQMLFFDWRLLENYNLFLDDVQIPVTEVSGLEDFEEKFEKLKLEFLQNFSNQNDDEGNLIWEKEQNYLKNSIQTSVKNIEISSFFEDEILENLINQKEHHGTKFVIFEPESQILNLVEGRDENNDSEFVRSSLAGFTNPFIEEKLPIETSFPIHKTIGNDYDFLTSKGNFFEPNDFKLADILIDGKFDGMGRFEGTLKIYDNEINYEFVNPRRKDKRNDYGTFDIKLGYSQGAFKDSKFDKGPYDKINSKVSEYGALYIFRDGFRVLPYGRPEADFLGFEERRSKRAGTYFFSYRRMFGFIGLKRERNDKLKDKSSREGLINNSQFRAFKDDLTAFFIDIAKEFFSDKAKQSIFLDDKKKFNEQSEALAKDKKRATQEKREYSKALRLYPKKLKDYKLKYEGLINELSIKTSQSKVIYSEIEDLLRQINQLDINYKDLLPETPKSYEPTELQLDRLAKYENEIVDFNGTIKKESEELILEARKKLEVKDLQIEFSKNSEQFKSSIEEMIYSKKNDLKTKFSSIQHDFDSKSTEILKEFDFQKQKAMNIIQTKEDAISGLNLMKSKFEFIREQIRKELFPLVEHIQKLNFEIDEELVQGAYRAEYENIKYRWEQTRETAQLGIAVEIIDHEFNVLYSQINSTLKRLEEHISSDASVDFFNLKSFFSSLEDKYALLSPLYRISGVVAKEIKGLQIFEYVQKFFDKRIQEENIGISASKDFLSHTITIKEPVIHTVLINIVNNAIYWLRDSETKKIILDYRKDTNEILLINSGRRIEDHRLNKIFELFYSNRPNGRGIGLYLSKQSLNENNFDIYATNSADYNKLNGACFVIKSLT